MVGDGGARNRCVQWSHGHHLFAPAPPHVPPARPSCVAVDRVAMPLGCLFPALFCPARAGWIGGMRIYIMSDARRGALLQYDTVTAVLYGRGSSVAVIQCQAWTRPEGREGRGLHISGRGQSPSQPPRRPQAPAPLQPALLGSISHHGRHRARHSEWLLADRQPRSRQAPAAAHTKHPSTLSRDSAQQPQRP